VLDSGKPIDHGELRIDAISIKEWQTKKNEGKLYDS
jgi:hypothetical protein